MNFFSDAEVRISESDNESGINGIVTFEQSQKSSALKVYGTLYGVPSGPHGFHVHEIGDTSNKCLASGGHFNPTNVSTTLLALLT